MKKTFTELLKKAKVVKGGHIRYEFTPEELTEFIDVIGEKLSVNT